MKMPDWIPITLSVLGGLAIPMLLMMALFSFMIFDAPGSTEVTANWIVFYSIWAIPLTILLAIILMWIFRNRWNWYALLWWLLVTIPFIVIIATEYPDDYEPLACPADVRLCPDGSVVGRVAPDCEFASCSETNIACPQDAKICPDGTAVGRVGPDCQFEPCPESTGFKECPTDAQEFCMRARLAYSPVCGKYILNTGAEHYETFDNWCAACTSMKVVGYTEGACK